MLHIAVERDDSETPEAEAIAQCGKTEEPQPPYDHPDVDGGWAFVVLAAMFAAFFINSGKMLRHYCRIVMNVLIFLYVW